MSEKTYEDLLADVTRLQDQGQVPLHPTRDQRIDWAYGNTKIENANITRQMVERAVDSRSQNLLAIDPGIDQGWAVFDALGDLQWCGLGEPPTLAAPHRLIIECPQVYPMSKADPNDLIKLAIRVGRLVERYSASQSVRLVYPREWKGQLPKPVHHRRLRAKLRAPEGEVLDRCLANVAPSAQHNVLDAVGLGLFAVSRG